MCKTHFLANLNFEFHFRMMSVMRWPSHLGVRSGNLGLFLKERVPLECGKTQNISDTNRGTNVQNDRRMHRE